MGIVATGAGVSFAHGSNDGQKGIGLIMIILIGILPNYYALNMDSHHYRITQTKDAASNLAKFYEDNSETIVQLVNEKRLISALKTNKTIAECNVEQIHSTISSVASKLNNLNSYSELSTKDRWSVRTSILCTDNFFAQAEKIYLILDKGFVLIISPAKRKLLVAPIEYAPYWVIMAVALAIGIGTMIGYQRIVHTIGEKIGAKPINYMQGTVAQATAMITILLANFAHMHLLVPPISYRVLSPGPWLQSLMVVFKKELSKSFCFHGYSHCLSQHYWVLLFTWFLISL